MCHRNTWWFKWFKSGKFQASISASPPPKLGIYHFDSFCVLVSVSWCFSQTSHANCGVNQIFRPNEDVLVSYGFSHGVLLISLKSGYRFQLFQHRPASACACFACSLAAKVSCKSCHGISRDFTDETYQKNLVSSAEKRRESGSRCLTNRFNVIQSCPMHVMSMFKVLHPFLCAADPYDPTKMSCAPLRVRFRQLLPRPPRSKTSTVAVWYFGIPWIPGSPKYTKIDIKSYANKMKSTEVSFNLLLLGKQIQTCILQGVHEPLHWNANKFQTQTAYTAQEKDCPCEADFCSQNL